MKQKRVVAGVLSTVPALPHRLPALLAVSLLFLIVPISCNTSTGAPNNACDAGSCADASPQGDGGGEGDSSTPPVACALDCNTVCEGRTVDYRCGNDVCGGWWCAAACAKDPSAPWCCIEQTGAITANGQNDCPASSLQGAACPQNAASSCGQPSTGCAGAGSAGCPYCCVGICGATDPACFARADCCSDSCGGAGVSGEGIECTYGTQDRCVDSSNDPSNCGSCGNQCPSAGPGANGPNPSECQGGTCQCGDGVAYAPLTLCANQCVNTLSDPNNCGQCGTKCATGGVCVEASPGAVAQCECPKGQTVVGTCCTPGLAIDSNNCGACGNVCAADSSCTAGQCVCNPTELGSGGNPAPIPVLCGGVCRDLTSDPANCGACGNACGVGTGCLQGICVTGATCPGGMDCACPTGQSVCGSTCVNMLTDSSNCGACGVTCNGTCAAGRCTVPLATGQAGDGMAVDGANVYWTNSSAGTVMQCAITGCNNAPTMLASGQSGPLAIAVDTGNVYWTNSTGNTVVGCAIGGCGQQPTVLASSQVVGTSTIAADGTNVYWRNGASIVECATGGCGGTPATLWSQLPAPLAFALGGASVYWTFDSGTSASATAGVMTCDIANCASSAIRFYSTPCGSTGDPCPGSFPGGAISAIATSATSVYWFAGIYGLNEPIGGGAVVESYVDSPTIMTAADPSGVYFVGGASLYDCPSAGCGDTPKPLEQGPATGNGVAVDATSVYWSTGGAIVKVTPK